MTTTRSPLCRSARTRWAWSAQAMQRWKDAEASSHLPLTWRRRLTATVKTTEGFAPSELRCSGSAVRFPARNVLATGALLSSSLPIDGEDGEPHRAPDQGAAVSG